MSALFWKKFWKGMMIGGIIIMLHSIPNVFWLNELVEVGILSSNMAILAITAIQIYTGAIVSFTANHLEQTIRDMTQETF